MVGKKPRERVIAGEDETTGTHRYRLYKAAFTRVKEASREGYHLEAITLLESLLSDRMESRVAHLTQTKAGFKTLGELISQSKGHEDNAAFRELLVDIDAWRKLRNRSLHELVKFEEGDLRTWHEKVAELEPIVVQGIAVLRAYDEVDRAERKKAGARPAATEPGAFT